MHSSIVRLWGQSLVAGLGVLAVVSGLTAPRLAAGDELPRIDQRFSEETAEVPDFQRHVVPLFGRLGCNGRACHGSFQGRGGLRLSLFGYDFAADHAALTDKDGPRVDPADPDASLIIAKPTDADEHEGGQRYTKGSWQYHVLRAWIAGGAKYEPKQHSKLTRLEVTPAEILFGSSQQTVSLRAVAVWEDGTREDVTPLCRFQTNDDEIAQVDAVGQVTAGGAGDTHVVVYYDIGVQPVPVLHPVSGQTGTEYPAVPTPTKIDELVVAKLSKLGIVPSELCSDEEFLRRVSLDLAGTLPTPAEITAFLQDTAADKRTRKIEQLLETPAYAAWWTTRLCDITGNNDTQLVNVVPTRNGQASQDWYDWIFKRVQENAPYDEIAAGIITAKSREPDQSYTDYCQEMSALYKPDSTEEFADRDMLPHYWARREFRSVESRAIGVAYTFMGVRIQCAQCHKHPFDQWTKDDFAQFQNFFAAVVASNRPPREDQTEYAKLVKQLGIDMNNGGQARRQLQEKLKQGETVPFPEVYVVKAQAGRPAARGNRGGGGRVPTQARLPGGATVDLTQYDDPRDALMQWLRDKDNPYFGRAFVNRIWENYFGIGIVSPPDDMSLGNPPSNKPLLDYLSDGFVASGFDMKWLHREIVNSRTYQLSWQPNETNQQDRRNFSHALTRRLPAEVIVDAVRQATASEEQIAQLHGSLEGRALATPGTVERGGRGADKRYALTVFGRSTRESNCDCDRSAEPSLLQTVYLQNDQDMHAALTRRDGWITELGREYGQGEAAEGGAQRPPGYQQRLAAQRARIRRLRSAGKTAEANQLQKQLTQLVKRYGLPGQAPESSIGAPKKPTGQQVNELVEDAYLRTLSRAPSDDELRTAQQYVQEAKDLPTGIRDVLWALVNTKEFIVNH